MCALFIELFKLQKVENGLDRPRFQLSFSRIFTALFTYFHTNKIIGLYMVLMYSLFIIASGQPVHATWKWNVVSKKTWKWNEDIITIKGLILENSEWTFKSNWTNLNSSPSIPEQIDGV
jgi:hypothetical protein